MTLCFSGTGNSLQVASRLATLLNEQLSLLPLDEKKRHLATADNRIIWVCPIYSWGIPPIVLKAIAELTFNPAAIHHLVATCGDDCGRADFMFREAIEKTGSRSGVAATVIMPNNYVTFPGFDVDSPELATEKISKMPARVDEVASMINASDTPTTSVTRGTLPRLKTSIIYPWFVRHAMSPLPFHHTPTCTQCGLCSSHCPTGNITMSPYPTWADNCAFCLRCYHICPHHGVGYGNKTNAKGQYINPRLLTLLNSVK